MCGSGRSTPSVGEDVWLEEGLEGEGRGWRCDGFGKSLIACGDTDCGRVVLEYSFDLCFAVFGSDGKDVVGYKVGTLLLEECTTSCSSNSIVAVVYCGGCSCEFLGDEFDRGWKHGWLVCLVGCLVGS